MKRLHFGACPVHTAPVHPPVCCLLIAAHGWSLPAVVVFVPAEPLRLVTACSLERNRLRLQGGAKDPLVCGVV